MFKFLTSIAMFFLAIVVTSTLAYAQCNPGSPCLPTPSSGYTTGAGSNDLKRGDSEACDGDFMNQIYARAFMEAERENVMAQTYIRKPDSVLEYTCMDRMISQVSSRATPIFSESTTWDGKTIPLNIAYTAAGNPTSIDLVVDTNIGSGNDIINPLQDVVLSALNTFASSNFNHDFLGDTAGLGSSLSGSVSGGAYSCGSMLAVWDIAKCQNFPAAPDLFWTFSELAAGDPRQLPTPACTGTQITPDLVTTAQNAGPAYASAQFDRLDPYLPLLMPAASTADCQPPVETGLQVIVYDFVFGTSTDTNPSGASVREQTIPERICINPGCYYHVDIDFSTTPATVNAEDCRRG